MVRQARTHTPPHTSYMRSNVVRRTRARGCHVYNVVAAPLEWQRGAEDLGSPLVRGQWWVILPAVEAYIVVERRVVGCTDMLAIAVQRV